MSDQLDPTPILQTATAFWASKVLLTAVEFDLFTALGEREMTAIELGDALGLHPRGTYDFFDALVAMGFLTRNGDGAAGRYRNTPLTAVFLDKRSASYIGGFPQMLNSRLFGFWNGLGEGLKTGKPQNEVKLTGRSMFEELYADSARLGEFLRGMSGLQTANFTMLAEKFDFSTYQTVTDVGGSLALLSRLLADGTHICGSAASTFRPSDHMRKQAVDDAGLSDRITVVGR